LLIEALRVSLLGPNDIEQLKFFFSEIECDPKATLFHPHPFNGLEATKICLYEGRDSYFGLYYNEKINGYGMLRGWDKGYAVPSLGIYISECMRQSGAAKYLMHYMHQNAILKGSSKVRLTVYEENIAAIKLYKNFGYEFQKIENEKKLVGVLNLKNYNFISI
jgi:ribosomal protein S18 acetylase RimI-like enzyme